MPHEKVEQVEVELNKPLPGRTRQVSDFERKKDAESFMAFAGAMGIAPPKTS